LAQPHDHAGHEGDEHGAASSDGRRRWALTFTAILQRLRQRLDCEHATVQLEAGMCAEPSGVDECHSRSSEIARKHHDRSDCHK
jgi:hypothetical protein